MPSSASDRKERHSLRWCYAHARSAGCVVLAVIGSERIDPTMTAPFSSSRRLASWLPFAAAIGVPLIILAVMGVFSFRQSKGEAELRAERTVQALAEHALRT